MTIDTSRRRYLRRLAATGAVATALPLAGCSGSGGNGGDATTEPSSETVRVEMTDELVYDPADIEVASGTTVVWETVGAVGHTVTAYENQLSGGAAYFASGGFDSESAARSGYPQEGNVAEGETYEHTFETRGEYGYFCIPHESADMVGTVTVT